jgi:hypothetical protein
MIRHTVLPGPGKGTSNAPTADIMPRTRPTFAPLLITDPDTVITTGRRQSAGHNGV